MGLLGLALFGAEPQRNTTTEVVSFAAGGTVRVDGSRGSVSVEGWDRPEVEVEVTRTGSGIVVKSEKKSEGELEISTRFTRRRGSVEYRIRVPRDCKVAIHHKDGQVLIREVTGEIEATSRSGDIVVMLPEGKYEIDARSKLGTVYSDFGDIRHRYLVGERLEDGAGRRVYLRVGVGGISIQDLGYAAHSPRPSFNE